MAREPVSAALTRDGRFLLVANHLPRGRSDVPYVAATVSVIDVAQRKVVKELRLPNGSINLRQICVSPDGKYACRGADRGPVPGAGHPHSRAVGSTPAPSRSLTWPPWKC